MYRLIALCLTALLLASGVQAQNDPRDPPRRPPQVDPAQPPGFPPGQVPPDGFPGFPGPPGFGPPGFPMGENYKELVTTLLDLLDDADAEVRQSVAQALAKIGRQSVSPLVTILKDEKKSAATRANAAYVLGQIGPAAREAIPALSKAVKEENKDLRKRAAFAIANIVTEEFQGFPGGGFPGGPMGMGGFGGGFGRPPMAPMRPPLDPGVVPPEKKPDPDKK